ncbi:MAG: DNA repair protein RecO [Flavobacteriales bacterium MED-G15]|nr:MAG: DNA repair protein RecO [Flavobacteriales bacterium MED-G15]|tara:strand:+ start:9035 stop:9763 length:729 start_codon:yes stop_codon:yes gene_type:complete
MLVETDAIVLSTLKYGDASLIARCYCKELGLKSFLLKGILSSKKGRLKKSFFQPLSLITLNTQIKNESKQGLNFIKEASVKIHFQEIPLDIKKNAVALFLSEVLTQVISEEGDPNSSLYNHIENGIIRLENEKFSPIFHLKFLIELSQQLGFYPNLNDQEKEYFDLESGCFCEASNSKYVVGGETAMAFKKLLGTDFDVLSQLDISNSIRIKVLEFLINYFNLHLPRFGKIKSVAILHEVFR